MISTVKPMPAISPTIDSVVAFVKDSWEKSSTKAAVFVVVNLREVRDATFLIEKKLQAESNPSPSLSDPSYLKEKLDDYFSILPKLSLIRKEFTKDEAFSLSSFPITRILDDVEGNILRILRILLISQASGDPENSGENMEESFTLPASR